MIRAVLLSLLVLAAPQLLAWTEADEERWMSLNQELRCLVCQNQSIADSHAELAQDLRKQVREMIEAGQSDDEIRAYMTERYGDFVLYRPPFKPLTLLLWTGPALMLLLAFLLVWRIRRNTTPASSETAGRRDLNALLKDAEND